MLMLHQISCSFESRVVQRQQRQLLQLPKKHSEPKAADSNHSEDVCQMNLRARGFVGRHYQPIDINQTQGQKNCGYHTKRSHAPLNLPLQEQKEWNEEVENEQNHGNHGPASESAGHIPRNLVLEVARPDDQKLRKRNISP